MAPSPLGWWGTLSAGVYGDTHTCQGGVSPHKGSWCSLHRLGAGTTRIAAATSKPMSSRWAVGTAGLAGSLPVGHPCWDSWGWAQPAKTTLSSQGFLSDLLKKANRPYDEPKLQEYTQTIVSGTWGSVSPPGVSAPQVGGVQGRRS